MKGFVVLGEAFVANEDTIPAESVGIMGVDSEGTMNGLAAYAGSE